MFNNEKLNNMIAAMPATPQKLPLTMLFVLLDSYLSGKHSETDFLNDLAVILDKDNKVA
jgi:hypothetical protein